MTEPEAHGDAVRISIGLLIVTACLGRAKSHKQRRSYLHFLQNNDYKLYSQEGQSHRSTNEHICTNALNSLFDQANEKSKK